jgi:dTDP-4-amino-4,6-dideoxygalactose transaminase
MNKDNPDEWKIPLYKIFTDAEDVNLITKIIKRGTRWAMGPEVEEFEAAIRNYVGVDYCVTLNSGTSALHAAYLAYGLQKNDEVIVPSFSFISTANSVLFVNANPVFADIEEDTFGLNPTQLEGKITSKTKAIVPVDYAGLSCKIFEIKEIAQNKNVLLIEDAAESLGSAVKGRKVGSVSDAAIFSFCGNKVLTTGEGGAIVTNSKEIYEKVKYIRSHGRIDKSDYFNNPLESQYSHLGYNWRMSSLTAGLGISQINKLPKIIKMRQENAEYISARLNKHKEIEVPKIPPNYEHIFQMFTIKLKYETTRDELHNFLIKKRVFSKIYFNPIHLTQFYKKTFGYREGSLPLTESISKRVLTLPLYPNMTKEEKDYLTDSVSEFFESKTKSA